MTSTSAEGSVNGSRKDGSESANLPQRSYAGSVQRAFQVGKADVGINNQTFH